MQSTVGSQKVPHDLSESNGKVDRFRKSLEVCTSMRRVECSCRHVCIYMPAYICRHTCAHTHTHIHVDVYIHVYLYITHIHLCTSMVTQNTYTHTYAITHF